MCSKYHETLVPLEPTGEVDAEGKPIFAIAEKKSPVEAEAPIILEISGRKAKLFTKFGVCRPAERTLEQWLCTILNGSLPMNDESDRRMLHRVCMAARCIFPVNESAYVALSLQERLQIVMGMEDWATDLKMGIRYHNDRDQFYEQMRKTMPNWTANDVDKHKKEDWIQLEDRFSEYAFACCSNKVDLNQMTFTKRMTFDSVSDLTKFLLIHFVDNNWRLQRCPVCENFFRSPSLKRETCSEECKREYERLKKKARSESDRAYHSAKNTFNVKCKHTNTNNGKYSGRAFLKEDFVKLLGFSEDEQRTLRERLDMGSNVFSTQNMNTIREWLIAQRVVVRREERIRKQGGPINKNIPSYEVFVLKFVELQKEVKFTHKDSENYDIGQ